MRVASVDAPSLLEPRAIVARRLPKYGAFKECAPEEQRTILAQAYTVIWHLTAGNEGRLISLAHVEPLADRVCYQAVLDAMARLCPDIIAAVQGYFTVWRARFWQDNRHATQWSGYCDGVNGAILEVFVTDTRQQILVACQRDAH